VHPESYVAALEEAAPASGLARIDADTTMSAGTFEAVLRAVGAATLAVDEVVTGLVDNAFCAMRPPGHHAERSQAMGFCFFNTAAIAARHAKAKHGVERVAVVDWDVHHGNGRQDIFWADPTVMYCSTHECRFIPAQAPSERGERHHRQRPVAGRRRRRNFPRSRRGRLSCRSWKPSGRTSSSSRPGSTPIGATRSPTST
jgi:acetoin utilization deacetylase AcuC-like enzyme